jgi:uncharacterized coiled-coil protein SlyX
MKHVTLNERLLTTQNHRQEKTIKELNEKLQQYREQLETMTNHITELKDLNKVLVNQIYSLSHKDA